LESGEFTIFGFWGESDIVEGFNSSMTESLCMSEVELERIEIENHPAELKVKIQNLEQLVKILQTRSIEQRLYLFLTWLQSRFGANFRVTHQDIAYSLNTTRVTVTRFLCDFEKEGKITRSKRRITVVS
jgi:CRP-like cAMP-binding protein